MSDLDPVVPFLTMLALAAPLCALEPFGRVLHAVTMEGIVEAATSSEMRSACGVSVGLFDLPIGSRQPVLWPPAVRSLGKVVTRCRPCWEATGRKRPRTFFVRKESA